MASVFLSYSREDAAKAEALAAALEGLGHGVWWDRRLEGGSRFSKEIEQALKSADVVLVIWSRASLESAWVQDEAAEGRDTGRLVPVVIDDSKPPLGFRQYQAIDLSAWKGRGGAAALDSVHRAILAKAGSVQQIEKGPRRGNRVGGGRRLVMVAAALLFLMAGGLGYWLFAPAGRGDPQALRLQIGEIKALSPDVPPTLAEALREELLAALATDAVIVASTEKPKQGGVPAYALTSSVRSSGPALLFTLHVVNQETGGTVWSDTLERSADGAEVAPRQVAVAVSQVLRCGLGGAARYGKPLPDETLSIYMNFCEEFWADTAGKPVNQGRAVDLARRLTEAAPDFSRGWSALAEVVTWASPGERQLDAKTLHAQAVAAAEKALDLDPENSEAYQALAGLQPPFAFTAREALHRKSIEVRPSDCGCEYVSYGGFLNRVGRNREAADAYRRAHDMIPLSAEVNVRWAEGLFLAGRAEEGRKLAADVLQMWPNYSFLHEILLKNAFWTRGYDEAEALLASPHLPLNQAERAALRQSVRALRSGNAAAKAAAVGELGRLAAGAPDFPPIVATALAALGAHREALNATAKRVDRDGPRLLTTFFEPSFAAARRLPQFAQMAQRFGLVGYWRQSRQRPDFCSEASPPALCARL